MLTNISNLTDISTETFVIGKLTFRRVTEEERAKLPPRKRRPNGAPQKDSTDAHRFSAEDLRGFMGEVARFLLGTPNRALSKGREMRYGTRGSLSIDLVKGVWRDHERGNGGGVLDLIERETGLRGDDRFAWLRENGFKPNGNESGGLGRIVATFDYTDAADVFQFQVVKFDPKNFRQRHRGADGKWIWNLKGVQKVLYRLPELIEDVAQGRTIVIVEGEKDVDALRAVGVPATCNPGGAGGWLVQYNEYLRGANVIIIGDNDPQAKHPKTGELLFHPDGRPVFPGQDHMRDVAAKLTGIARQIRLIDLGKMWLECPPKGDVFNYLESGHTREQLDALVGAAPDYEPSADKQNGQASADKQNGMASGDAQTDFAPAFSEEAIAIDFAHRHADRLRYVAKWNQWFCWDGTCWREDETRKVFSIARGLCRELALTMNKSSESKRIASAKTRAAVVSLAGEDYRLAATTDQWDTDPWLLNTPDGAVDLRTGQMREHRTDDYMTKQTAVAPAGDCPRWKAFLDEVTAGDRELQAYLQGVSGYCLTGITREQQLYFMYGSGQNGKGVFVQTISGIMGDYHRATSIETFTVSQSERHPTELAALRGARLVTAAETEDGRRWAEARIKEMTGGDKIQARFMRQDFFEFFPQFKLIFSGNHMPTLRTINKAITRRFNRVPFAVTIVAEKMNLYLTEELRAEWPGILAWMIKGCLMWQRDGLKPPQAVTAATDQYLESQDAIGEWLKECCELAPGFWESTQELFTSWKPWAGERGEWIGSKNQFSQKLEDRGGFVPQRSEDRKHRGFRGLRLRRPSTIDELVDRWINECCELGNDFWTDAVQASKSWQAFIKKQDGVSGVSALNLEQTLRTRELACSNGAKPGWRGLRIKETDRPAAAGSAGDAGADDADVMQP